jgi:hypothetical protein
MLGNAIIIAVCYSDFYNCVGARNFFKKNKPKKFCRFKKKLYFCKRYPENNLFTLKKRTNTY